EAEEDEPDIMNRPPRRLEEPLFGRAMILSGLIQGLGILAVVVTIYAVMLTRGYDETVARMLAFVCMVIGNLGLIFANRSWKHSIWKTIRIPNKALWWVTGGAAVFLTLVLSIPFLHDLFKFAPLNRWETVLIAFSGLASVLIAESVKIKGVQKFIRGGRNEK
ncbi:MAG: cation-translocating P-type ATPase C-terminal domain-containing protein, partial [Anaerolineales bacterium]|nr:cation-translocating P-type ATPase C-terminal domain-containing protein [Anaerolineales bacterium]